jgi:hypothetical protein
VHRGQNFGVLPHVQIIVRTPHRDRAPAAIGSFGIGMEVGFRVVAALPHDVSEHAIAAFPPKRSQSILEAGGIGKCHA